MTCADHQGAVRNMVGDQQRDAEGPQPVRKANWRQQHEDFIIAIQSAKQCSLAMKEGRPLPPPPPASINPGKGSDKSKKRTNGYQCRGSSAAEQGPGGHESRPSQARLAPYSSSAWMAVSPTMPPERKEQMSASRPDSSRDIMQDM
ncbi:Protein FAM164B [Myotis davidii]|uniref:Protein FAM164B n=1 Tax=Myotis davidii TaxID=225400 RepID=L5MDT3_MYODS|nr:Protein FAM164B [Myotis davidii]